MKKRNPALVILFSIITCGIYELYWLVATTNDVQRNLKTNDGSCRSGGMVILFSIITCGIYMFYWWFKMGKRVAQLQADYGVNPSDNSAIHLILMFIGGIGAIINPILMQSNLNSVVDAVNGARAE